jgi:DUF1365 family protein
VRSALYEGHVMHARLEPARNVFRYPVYMTLVDLDELPELDRRLRLFGWNRSRLASLQDRDHIDVRAFLAEHGVELGGRGRILLLTNLRVLGYVFNPVSFYWCYAADGSLACIVAEVSNTFGERLPYLLRGDSLRYDSEKRLHVSPFMPMEQRYTWQFSEPEERILARIDLHDAAGKPFVATLAAERVELTNASLARFLVRYPLMPLKVTALIHLQAVRLWWKHVPFHRKPPFEPGRGSLRP